MRRRLAAVAAAVALLVPFTGTAQADTPLANGTVLARSTGQPVAGACVTVFDDGQGEVARGCADDTGHYTVSGAVRSGYYRVRTTAEGYADTWYAVQRGTDARTFADADPTYLYGQRLDLGLRPPGAGVLRGRLTVEGAPVANASVQVVDLDGEHWGATASTDAEGAYRLGDLWPGHYQLLFRTPYHGEQWYHQSESQGGAQVVVVRGDVDEVVDEQVFPPGTVELDVVDKVSGRPVRNFCAFTPGVGADRPCTTDGHLSLRLNRGQYTLYITPEKSYFGVDHPGVVVVSGETTRVTALAEPGVAIRTTVRDARTGQPVAGTCVQPVVADSRGMTGQWEREWCSDTTGAVTIGPLPPAAYRLFARPGEGPHGAQWVGWLGGTGDERAARVVDGRPGTYTTLPSIRLDRAGAVTGTVTDRQTGAPVAGVCVFPYAASSAYGEVCTDATGAYRLTGLGPYRWPLEYAHRSETYAWQWSGGAADRFGASRVRVVAGRDTRADEKLVPGATVTGLATVDRDRYAWVDVTPVNARTGDIAGPVGRSHGSDYAITGLGTQELKLHFRVVTADAPREAWYRDQPSFTAATPVAVTAGTTVTGIDQKLPRS